jgi:UDP-2,4-diacetamido-2,4,6-trideoxy-beta-L-altropyranose hydrolase
MLIYFKADASKDIGTGHAMRSLTLASAFASEGIDVILDIPNTQINWLEERINASQIKRIYSRVGVIAELQDRDKVPDLTFIDSYEFDNDYVSIISSSRKIMQFVDYNSPSPQVWGYLDQNLGSELLGFESGYVALRGSRFALIRSEIQNLIQERKSVNVEEFGVTCLFGGSTSTIPVEVSRSLSRFVRNVKLDFVAPPQLHQVIIDHNWHASVEVNLHLPGESVLELMCKNSVALSTSGSTAWELATIGIPSALFSIANNQSPILDAANAFGCGIGLGSFDEILKTPEILQAGFDSLMDLSAQERMKTNCVKLFDGNGTQRVVDFILEELECD